MAKLTYYVSVVAGLLVCLVLLPAWGIVSFAVIFALFLLMFGPVILIISKIKR